MSLYTDNLEEEDSLGGEVNDEEFTLIIHGFKTDFISHPLDFAQILDTVESTLQNRCSCQGSWINIVISHKPTESPVICNQSHIVHPHHKNIRCDSAENYTRSPSPFCDKLGSPLTDIPFKAKRTCLCCASVNDKTRSKWHFTAANGSSPNLNINSNKIPPSSSVHTSGISPITSRPSCSVLGVGQSPASPSINEHEPSSYLTEQTIKAGLMVISPVSKRWSTDDPLSNAVLLRRTSAMSAASSGYGSDFQRLHSVSSDKDCSCCSNCEMDASPTSTIALGHRDGVNVCHSTDAFRSPDSFLSRDVSFERSSSSMKSQTCQAARRLFAASPPSTICKSRAESYKWQPETIEPHKAIVSSLDSSLGLGSDPGYNDFDAESGISEDMGSNDETSDLDFCPPTGTGNPKGKKSARLGSKLTFYSILVFKTSNQSISSKIPIGVRQA